MRVEVAHFVTPKGKTSGSEVSDEQHFCIHRPYLLSFPHCSFHPASVASLLDAYTLLWACQLAPPPSRNVQLSLNPYAAHATHSRDGNADGGERP